MEEVVVVVVSPRISMIMDPCQCQCHSRTIIADLRLVAPSGRLEVGIHTIQDLHRRQLLRRLRCLVPHHSRV